MRVQMQIFVGWFGSFRLAIFFDFASLYFFADGVALRSAPNHAHLRAPQSLGDSGLVACRCGPVLVMLVMAAPHGYVNAEGCHNSGQRVPGPWAKH